MQCYGSVHRGSPIRFPKMIEAMSSKKERTRSESTHSFLVSQLTMCRRAVIGNQPFVGRQSQVGFPLGNLTALDSQVNFHFNFEK